MADTLEYNEELIKTEKEEKKVPYKRRWGDRIDEEDFALLTQLQM